MHLAENWETAAAAAAGLAVVAKLARAVTWSGAVAGLVVGVAVAAGFGPAGLVVLGTFFVVGSVATRVGYAKKAARGAAEKRGGARDWRNVVGKGGVAALIALAAAAEMHVGSFHWPQAFAGAVAAALADTLGTEIGSLSRGDPMLPGFRRVPAGTPGAFSWLGLGAGAAGAAGVAIVALCVGLVNARHPWLLVTWTAVAGVAASLGESLAVGGGWRAPGFVRNLLTTSLGAWLADLEFLRIMN